MNWLLAIAFLALFWLLMESGQLFFSFLALIVFFLVLVAGAKEKPERHEHGDTSATSAGSGPVIVRTKGTKIPKVIKIGVKPQWHGTSTAEDFSTSAAGVLLFPLKMLVGFFRRKTD